jgi:RecB family exonuclease
MQNTLTVLPSSRSIRQRILSQKNSNTFLEPTITIAEFLNKILIVKDAKSLDSDRRDLLLLEASDFKNFSSLQIERNFFTFIQNSSYIFRFLEELSAEGVDIDSIELADTYGDYEEHLAVLNQLYKRYESICKREGVLESIFLKKEYRLNHDYLKRFKKLSIVLEGYLTNFELDILLECSKIITLEIEYESTKYNKKTSEKFINLGFNIVEGYRYILNLSDREIDKQEQAIYNNNILCKQFTQRLEQIAFIKQQLYLMIKEGIEPEHIAIIVPDESFAKQIRLFDDEKNFNFAMGRLFSESRLYKKLDSAIELLDNQTIQNSCRVDRLAKTLHEKLLPVYHQPYTKELFEDVVQFCLKDEDDSRIVEIIEQEIYSFLTLDEHLKSLSLKQVLHIFLKRLQKLSIDDVGGGKITVMGLLESRGISYDGVIIVDFNEAYVPRSSEKDLFLNTTIRKNSGLPTTKDRESLQKHYYYLLISRAKKVAISYVENDTTIASRFLTQLGIEDIQKTQSDEYISILFSKGELKPLHVKDIKAKFDFTNFKLSATSLKSFLTCKRQFFYRYIAKIESHDIPKELPQEYEIGDILHNGLKSLYENRRSFSDVESLKKSFEDILDNLNEQNPLMRYQIKLWKRRLNDFYLNEIERFKAGYEVYSCEESLTCKYGDLTLFGKIDRLDKIDNGFEVLDYKSGNYKLYTKNSINDATDFQLEFYYLLASTLAEVKSCAFYDLQSAEVIPEVLFEEKLELLKSHFKYLQETKEFNFELCEDIKQCQYCGYQIVCDRLRD